MVSPSASKMLEGRDGMEVEEELAPKPGDQFPRHLEPMYMKALEAYIEEMQCVKA